MEQGHVLYSADYRKKKVDMFSLARRRFIVATSGTIAAAGLSAAIPLGSRRLVECLDQRNGSGASLIRVTKRSRALGSDVTITALSAHRQVAAEAIDAAFAELRLVEQLMSIYRPDSQLCRLNRTGELEDPHPYLVEVLNKAVEVSAQSNGAFDITVQPLWKAYYDAARRGRLPDDSQLVDVRSHVDWRNVIVSPRRILLKGPATEITLNGIAQGFAADRAMAALRARAIDHALIDTGETGALGRNGSGTPWVVGIQHPRQADALISLLAMDGRCLATSGDYATTFGDNPHCNHVFDPRTGRSPTEFSSVSVVAPTAMEADALSTAVFVLGKDQGMELLRSMPGTDLFVVLKNGRTMATDRFPLTT
jgi:thiamine biosynthesis lipoprotein